jgi:hypothetical protein
MFKMGAVSPLRVGVLVAGLVLGGNAAGHAAELERVDWIPGGGTIVGDVWTFNCPAGGSVTISVDTFAERSFEDGSAASGLDPVIDLFEGGATRSAGATTISTARLRPSADSAARLSRCPAVRASFTAWQYTIPAPRSARSAAPIISPSR